MGGVSSLSDPILHVLWQVNTKNTTMQWSLESLTEWSNIIALLTYRCNLVLLFVFNNWIGEFA